MNTSFSFYTSFFSKISLWSSPRTTHPSGREEHLEIEGVSSQLVTDGSQRVAGGHAVQQGP